jgi:hypothetical protein
VGVSEFVTLGVGVDVEVILGEGVFVGVGVGEFDGQGSRAVHAAQSGYAPIKITPVPSYNGPVAVYGSTSAQPSKSKDEEIL